MFLVKIGNYSISIMIVDWLKANVTIMFFDLISAFSAYMPQTRFVFMD